MDPLNLIKDILVFSIAYVPPLIIFDIYWLKMKKNKVLLCIINIIYIISSVYTENIIPFIFVLIDIRFMKFTNEFYYFNTKRFKFLEGLRLTAISYLMTIAILLLQNAIASSLKFNMNQQEIVNHMEHMSFVGLILMTPVVIVFAPILEEFVFRWLFFEKIFKSRLGLYFGAITSSLIFSFIHFSFTAFFVILWIGIYNCYLIHKKGYWYAVLNHSIFNSMTMIALFTQKLSEYGFM